MIVLRVDYYTTLMTYLELRDTERFNGHKEVVEHVGLASVICESNNSGIECYFKAA